MTDTERRVRESFFRQAGYCRDLSSPFTADLCDLLGERLSSGTAVGTRVLAWPGNPEATHDALALRLVAGLHALALRGTDPSWSAVYPPHLAPDRNTLGSALEAVLVRHAPVLLPWLDLPPQTNEVGRSAGLMSGLLVLAAAYGRPFALFEIGSSGGLNLVLDRYSYELGSTRAGATDSPVHLAPNWSGSSPPLADVQVAARRGVDQAPIDVSAPAGRERLLAYVWADQLDRLRRLRNALSVAAADPPVLDKMDAAAWVEQTITPAATSGVHRVLMHSVVFQYLSPEGQGRITAHMDAVGANATADAPVSWLRMEQLQGSPFELRCRTWPGGEDRCLATAHAHGAWIKWNDG